MEKRNGEETGIEREAEGEKKEIRERGKTHWIKRERR